MTKRHDAVCGALKNWCEEFGCHVDREIIVPNASGTLVEARMDLVIRAPEITGPVLVDVTIVSPTSRDALAKGAAVREGAAASIAAGKKRAKYPNIAVVPFVIEEFGRLGEDAIGLVKKIAPKQPDERTTALKKLYHAVGATMQRTAANAVLAAMKTN